MQITDIADAYKTMLREKDTFRLLRYIRYMQLQPYYLGSTLPPKHWNALEDAILKVQVNETYEHGLDLITRVRMEQLEKWLP